MARDKLIVFGPLPPARNGLADYVYGLLPHLEKRYECVVVLSDDAPTPANPLSDYLFESEYRRYVSFQCERHLFQLGNNTGVRYVLPYIGSRRGLVTIHDMTLFSLMANCAPGGVEGASFKGALEAAHGKCGLEVLSIASRYSGLSEHRSLALSMVPLIAKSAAGIVVHSELARIRAIGDGIRCPIFLIPCFSPAPLSPLRARYERSSQFVELLALGFVGKTKRIDLALRAVAVLVGLGMPVRLTIAGEQRPDEYDVVADIAQLGIGDNCRIIDYVDEATMSELIASADILVNLRWPTHGESSGPLLRALWLGVCAVVTDVGSFMELPDDTVVKIRPTEMTGDALAERLLPLVLDRQKRHHIGKSARQFAHANLSAESAAKKYNAAIESVHGLSSEKSTYDLRFEPLTGTPFRNPRLSEHVGVPRLWSRGNRVPKGSSGSVLLMVGGDERSRAQARDIKWSSIETLSASGKAKESFADGALVLDMPKEIGGKSMLAKELERALRPSSFILANWLVREDIESDQDENDWRQVLETLGFTLVEEDQLPAPPLVMADWVGIDSNCAESCVLAVRRIS